MVSLHNQWNPDFVGSPGEKKMAQSNNNHYYIKILHCRTGEGKFALVLIIHKVKKKMTGLKPGILAVAYMTFNCRNMTPILWTLVQVINLPDKIKFWAFLCLKFSPLFP